MLHPRYQCNPKALLHVKNRSHDLSLEMYRNPYHVAFNILYEVHQLEQLHKPGGEKIYLSCILS